MPVAGIDRRTRCIGLRGVALAELTLGGEPKCFTGSSDATAPNFTGGGVDREVRGPVIGEEDELVRTHANSVTRGV
jgi:hypothetical protein